MHEIINAVIIDNEVSHLLAVSDSMSKHGISTFPIHYQGAAEAFELCRGIAHSTPRIFIIDIQITSTKKDPEHSDYANVAKCIELLIEHSKGPYIVLAWSDKPDFFNALKNYVMTFLEESNLNKPYFFDLIDKTTCKTDSQFDVNKIFERFISYISGQKSVRALLAWEKQVVRSAQITTDQILHISNENLTSTIKALGYCVAGKHLNGNESVAINEALMYILKDKISYSNQNNTTIASYWKEAINDGENQPTNLPKGKLNSALHLDEPSAHAPICPGQMYLINNPQELFSLFETTSEIVSAIDKLKQDLICFSKEGIDLEEKIRSLETGPEKENLKQKLRSQFVAPRNDAKSSANFLIIEISPLCDFANKKKLFHSFCIGLIIPAEKITDALQIKSSESTIKLLISHNNEEKHLVFSAKYILSLSDRKIRTDITSAVQFLRVRETILQSWIHKISSYNSRIGTISF